MPPTTTPQEGEHCDHFLQTAHIPQFRLKGPTRRTQTHEHTDNAALSCPPGLRRVSQAVEEGVVHVQVVFNATGSIDFMDLTAPPAPHKRI